MKQWCKAFENNITQSKTWVLFVNKNYCSLYFILVTTMLSDDIQRAYCKTICQHFTDKQQTKCKKYDYYDMKI